MKNLYFINGSVIIAESLQEALMINRAKEQSSVAV